MKIIIEMREDLNETEVVIRCREIDESIQRLQRLLREQSGAPTIAFYKDNEEYYFPLDDVLFFETNVDRVFAHTAQDAFRIKQRLYELEELLPRNFLRVSKSTILNYQHIYSLQRNLTGASLVQFRNTHKEVYVSRLYYRVLREALDERSKTQ